MDQRPRTLPGLPDERALKARSLDDLHSTFIQNVSHELRTPLAIIHGYAELLRDGTLGTLAPEQKEAVFLIANHTYELRTVVERISILMAIEAGATASLPLALDEIVTGVVEKRRTAATQAGLALDVRLEPGLPPVVGDEYHLRQTVDCLLDNAFKFTPGGGRVEVQVYTEPGWVCLAVADTGIGMTQEELERISARFSQIDSSTTRRYGGIGLGLTVVRAVATDHAARIEVESQPGRGSRFTVRFPVLPAGVRTTQAVEEATVPRRILIVDDEENVTLTLQEGLEKLPNCDIVTATGGQQALQLFEQQPFDLLITDYKMPGTDGMTLATRIRQLYPRTVIIMITAYNDDELREQAARAAIRSILDKPVRLAEIRDVALEALGQA